MWQNISQGYLVTFIGCTELNLPESPNAIGVKLESGPHVVLAMVFKKFESIYL